MDLICVWKIIKSNHILAWASVTVKFEKIWYLGKRTSNDRGLSWITGNLGSSSFLAGCFFYLSKMTSLPFLSWVKLSCLSAFGSTWQPCCGWASAAVGPWSCPPDPDAQHSLSPTASSDHAVEPGGWWLPRMKKEKLGVKKVCEIVIEGERVERLSA